jgi:hypothetical protein
MEVKKRGSFESDLRTGFCPAASLNSHLLLDMITFFQLQPRLTEVNNQLFINSSTAALEFVDHYWRSLQLIDSQHHYLPKFILGKFDRCSGTPIYAAVLFNPRNLQLCLLLTPHRSWNLQSHNTTEPSFYLSPAARKENSRAKVSSVVMHSYKKEQKCMRKKKNTLESSRSIRIHPAPFAEELPSQMTHPPLQKIRVTR